MAYKIKYDDEADILTVVVADKGKLSYAEEAGDIIVHFDENGKPLFMEILKASKIVPQLPTAQPSSALTINKYSK